MFWKKAAELGVEHLNRNAERHAAAAGAETALGQAALQRAIDVSGSIEDIQLVYDLQDRNRAREHRRTMIRRGAAAGTATAVAGAGIGAAILVPKLLLPHKATVTSVEVTGALEKVTQRNDAIILTGQGNGTANITTREEYCNFLGCLGIPGTNENASATVTADLDIIQKAGSVTLQTIANGKGKAGYHVLATINTAGTVDQLSNEQIQTGGNPQFFPEEMTAFGLGGNTNNDNHDAAIAIAANNFEASCSQPLSEAIVPAEAHAIQQDINEVAGALTIKYPGSATWLKQLAGEPIDIQLTGPRAHGGPFGISPTSITLPTPDFVGNSDQHLPTPPGILVGLTVDALLSVDHNTCMETPAAADELGAIRAQQNYELLP